jgi:hypothetical protein
MQSFLLFLRDRLKRLSKPLLPLPTAFLYHPFSQAAITALGILPLLCFFLQLSLLIYGVRFPFPIVLLAACAVFALAAVRFYECLAQGFDRFDLASLAFVFLVVLVTAKDVAVTYEKLILFLMLPALLWVMRSIPHPRVYRGAVITMGVLLAAFYLLVAHTGIAAAKRSV